jgi:hypothetical protein
MSAHPKAIDDFRANLQNLIMGAPQEFIMKMDEFGFADYPDARCQTVMVLWDCCQWHHPSAVSSQELLPMELRPKSSASCRGKQLKQNSLHGVTKHKK